MNHPRHFLAGLVALFVAASAHAQDLTRRAPPQAEPIAIINAVVHPGDGPIVGNAGNGWILFDRGVIADVGEGEPRFAANVRVIDASGLHAFPGLVSPYTQLGLTEIQSVRASNDLSEAGSVSPEACAVLSVNPDSTLLPVTRSNGVLAAGVFPTGGVIPGRAGVIRLEGWTPEDMTVEKDIGVVVAWPYMRSVRAPWMDKSDDDQAKDIRRNVDAIDSAFSQARAYGVARAADSSLPVDIRWDAMLPALPAAGPAQKRVYIEANDYDQIVAAVAFAARNSLKCVIIGGRDAPMCAELLKRHAVPVIVTGTFRFPKRDDSPYDDAFTLPARLEQAGILWSLAGGDDTAHERNLPYAAAIAVAYSGGALSSQAALKAITRSAAEILGVSDRLGTLAKGKEATLFLADGDILEVATNVKRAFIAGRDIDLTNKQTELEKKYREKYRPVLGSPETASTQSPPAASPTPARVTR
ncbi:MAG: amidohydrolase family protein [Phycisphaeraceae bacterium]|nr:amidohydrolase family protein [Phycisphaeraceae bacterium]